jgi:hypothetical protein
MTQRMEPISDKGCLGWAARIPATAGLLVLVAAAIDLLVRGPVPRWQATVLIVLSAVIVAVFVYLGALVEADFHPALAIRRVPAVFAQAALLLTVVWLYTLASNTGSGGGGGGGGAGGGGAAGSQLVRRTNLASELVDPAEFAAILGVRTMRAEANWLSTAGSSRAVAFGTDDIRRKRPRVTIAVSQGRVAELKWARANQSQAIAGGPGEAAHVTGNLLIFKRNDRIVELRLSAYNGDTGQKLLELGGAVDRRLT